MPARHATGLCEWFRQRVAGGEENVGVWYGLHSEFGRQPNQISLGMGSLTKKSDRVGVVVASDPTFGGWENDARYFFLAEGWHCPVPIPMNLTPPLPPTHLADLLDSDATPENCDRRDRWNEDEHT